MGCGTSSVALKESNKPAEKNKTNEGSEKEDKKTEGTSAKQLNVIFVLGGPGSGKGTQCTMIKEEFKYEHLSAGDLLRNEVKSGSEQGKNIEEIMKRGDLVPSEVIIALMKKEIDSRSNAVGFLVDGLPRNLEQAHMFEKEIVPCKFVLNFVCTEEEMEARIMKRSEQSSEKRVDDNIETLKKRFETHTKESLPVLDFFKSKGKVHEISAVGTIEEVYGKVRPLFLN